MFLWFIILSGVTDRSPLSKTYFLRADTSGITGARDVTQWTYFFFCGRDNHDCGHPRPAPALGKAWDGRASNVPADLIGSHGGHTTSFHYYYMWRFGWTFFLITLFFETLTFFSAFLACCGRLGAAVAAFVSLVALFFSTIATVLMTYVPYPPPFSGILLILTFFFPLPQCRLRRSQKPFPRRRPQRQHRALRLRLRLGLVGPPLPLHRPLPPRHHRVPQRQGLQRPPLPPQPERAQPRLLPRPPCQGRVRLERESSSCHGGRRRGGRRPRRRGGRESEGGGEGGEGGQRREEGCGCRTGR